MKNIAVISLGCDKNRVDTEHMLYNIMHGGFAVSDIRDADVIIVNTCAFIESAREESIDTVLSCAELKKTGKCKRLIVTGCLPQKYRAELVEALPEVDAFLGTDEYDKIADVIGGNSECACARLCPVDFDAAENSERMLTTYPHVAYLKIADGCNNKCTFCTIPSIRGKYRSRKIADIAAEADELCRDGVKELILVAQDVTRFGSDRNDGENLFALLDALEKTDVRTIRLLYCYPECVDDALIEKISSSPKIAKYIDIPIQHCSDRILKLMNRRTTKAELSRLFGKLHDKGIVVRTTLMVGFPGESESEFSELCEFVETAMPEYAGIFAYSKEEGTPASRLPDQVRKSEKLKRVKALGAIAAKCTRAFNESMLGKVIDVVYEDVDYGRNMFIGRADFQTPDVDGRVLFIANRVDVGNVYKVRITKCDDYDLYGEVCE